MRTGTVKRDQYAVRVRGPNYPGPPFRTARSVCSLDWRVLHPLVPAGIVVLDYESERYVWRQRDGEMGKIVASYQDSSVAIPR
jgi:hypothetical protein